MLPSMAGAVQKTSTGATEDVPSVRRRLIKETE